MLRSFEDPAYTSVQPCPTTLLFVFAGHQPQFDFSVGMDADLVVIIRRACIELDQPTPHALAESTRASNLLPATNKVVVLDSHYSTKHRRQRHSHTPLACKNTKAKQVFLCARKTVNAGPDRTGTTRKVSY
ncbi:hypothetical protein M404DRAFT_1000891 [Pisolithus tinctorius Marx 270]|uniref:Uncharacterized protein n=1 Tax=Pisolithus tinctorius Marx 270 TaxID=870435 RepID=A0A0C3K3G3_PISTI|nr:hypothetical protein M404DRAFT_1000891 [Pisolithus tinctorius Marx 270]